MLKVFMRYKGIDKNNFDKLIEGINDVIVRRKEIAKFLSNDEERMINHNNSNNDNNNKSKSSPLMLRIFKETLPSAAVLFITFKCH